MSCSMDNWIRAAQNRDAWRCFVNMVMNEVYMSYEKLLRAVWWMGT
jgi:hypothetical protein